MSTLAHCPYLTPAPATPQERSLARHARRFQAEGLTLAEMRFLAPVSPVMAAMADALAADEARLAMTSAGAAAVLEASR